MGLAMRLSAASIVQVSSTVPIKATDAAKWTRSAPIAAIIAMPHNEFAKHTALALWPQFAPKMRRIRREPSYVRNGSCAKDRHHLARRQGADVRARRDGRRS